MRCMSKIQNQYFKSKSGLVYINFIWVLFLFALLSTTACVPADGELGSTQGGLDYSEDAVSYSDIDLEEEELETDLVFQFVNDPYCGEVAGTIHGFCSDQGCKKRGGKCKAVDSDSDGIRDNCICKGTKNGSAKTSSDADGGTPSVTSTDPDGGTPSVTSTDLDGETPYVKKKRGNRAVRPLPAPKSGVSTAKGGCTVTAGTIYGICADSGCKKRGGKCKAVDTDSDGLRDDCKCIGAKKGSGTSNQAAFNY
jgi:hypothetical protein